MKKRIKNAQKLFRDYDLNTLPRILLSCFIIISFFYAAPIFINFSDKNLNNKEFTNNSKKNTCIHTQQN